MKKCRWGARVTDNRYNTQAYFSDLVMLRRRTSFDLRWNNIIVHRMKWYMKLMNHTLNYGYEIKWSYDPRHNERNFSNCVEKREILGLQRSLIWRNGFKPRWSPEFFRLLYAFAKIASVTARIMASLDFISAVQYVIHFIYHFIRWFIHHENLRTHKWPAHNIDGVIAQLVRVWHRYREVTGSNPVDILNFQASLRSC